LLLSYYGPRLFAESIIFSENRSPLFGIMLCENALA
jgi:hypothetical protein